MNRRGFLRGALGVLCAPLGLRAIRAATLAEPVKPIPPQPVKMEFWDNRTYATGGCPYTIHGSSWIGTKQNGL